MAEPISGRFVDFRNTFTIIFDNNFISDLFLGKSTGIEIKI